MLPGRDVYGVELTENRIRARGCRHEVPCLTFICISSHHRGSRRTPWCRGCDDCDEMQHLIGETEYEDMGRGYTPDRGWCDVCWSKTLRGYIRKRVRDFKRWKRHLRPPMIPVSPSVQRPVQSLTEYRNYLWSRNTWLPEAKIG